MHLDTHVVAWLYDGLAERFPKKARAVLEREQLAISPMVLLELDLLVEIGRRRTAGAAVLADLASRIGLGVSPTPFVEVVTAAGSLTWTHDPFDRLIVAQAIASGAGLLTKDRTLRSHFPAARWG